MTESKCAALAQHVAGEQRGSQAGELVSSSGRVAWLRHDRSYMAITSGSHGTRSARPGPGVAPCSRAHCAIPPGRRRWQGGTGEGGAWGAERGRQSRRGWRWAGVREGLLPNGREGVTETLL